MNTTLKSALALSALALAAHASAQVTLYEHADFGGRTYSTDKRVTNFNSIGFNDRASSVVVERGRWEVCEDSDFHGYCVVLRPGRYNSLSAMDLNDRVSSIRAIKSNEYVAEQRYAPLPAPVAVAEDFRRRPGEHLYTAKVSDVRAVVGPPEQRCWTENEQVTQERKANVGGAVLGAVVGGILGHQVGGGTGRDIATVGGAVAGGALGSRAGHGRQETTTQPVQHCETVQAQTQPEYWDVTYNFRGLEHKVQMTSRPGSTITVNSNGEPRS